MLKNLRQEVLEANLEIVRRGLVLYTFGNVSGIDRERGLVVIKPSGVPYERMKASDLVVTDLDGRVVEGELRPSSDLATHLVLYKSFPTIGGVTHTHSRHATSWAQAQREIPCFGTTHADYFHGCVPLTRMLTKKEVDGGYEVNTGHVIVERFTGLDPLAQPGVLVAGHAPFAWGADAMKSAEMAVILEEIAALALNTVIVQGTAKALPQHVQDKHYFRKHGKDAYYGQK